MSYKICSFNVLRSVRGDDTDREFYGFINDLIRNEGIDIFAFQEARDINFIKNLLRNLPHWWKGVPLYNSELAFVWNSYRVKECSRQGEPSIFESYKSNSRLFREPAYGRFMPVDFYQNFEFRLINIHLVHGGNDFPQTIVARKIECDLVKGEIFQKIDKPPPGKDGSFISVFTVIPGDYNLNCDECNACGPENVMTFQYEATTLKQKEEGYKSSYDHFSYDVEKNSSVPRMPPTRIDAVKDYFKGDFVQYRQKVSDHVPVKLEILR